MEMGSAADFYEYSTCAQVDKVKAQELDAVDFESVVYETATYEVVPTIVLSIAGEPVVKYGIYNKETCVMEADASQIVTAKSWANALTEAAEKGGGESATFGPSQFTLADDDEPQVH